MFRYRFTNKNIDQAVKFLKTGKGNAPSFVGKFKNDLSVKGKKLFYKDREVISQERRDDVFREELYKKGGDVPTARDSGFHILKQKYVGLSKHKLNEFIRAQKPLGEVKQALAKPKQSGGPKLKNYTFETDLVFLRKTDLENSNKKFIRDDIKDETYFVTCCEKLSGLSNYAYVKTKEAKVVTPIVIEQCKKIAKQLGTTLKKCDMQSDAGGEFNHKEFRKHFKESKTVPIGPAVEQKNKLFQHNFFKIIRQRKANTVESARKQAETLMNNTMNKYHRLTPNEVAEKSEKELLSVYNGTRQRHVAGDNRKPFEVGQHVRILAKAKKAGLDYKTYKGKTYTAKVYVIKGKTKKEPHKYRVNGKWYLQADLEKSNIRDEKSIALVKERDEEEKKERDEAHEKHLIERIAEDNVKNKLGRLPRAAKKKGKLKLKQMMHKNKVIDDALDEIEETGDLEKDIDTDLPKKVIQKAEEEAKRKYVKFLAKYNMKTTGTLEQIKTRAKMYKKHLKRMKKKKTI